MIKKRKTTKINLRKPPNVRNEARSAIGERNRITLAYMELARDKTFQRLSEEQKLHTVREVLSIGDEVAGWVLAEYDTNDPRKIASKLGVRVFGEDRGKKKGAEYRKGKNEIVVYRDFHEKLVREIKSAELSDHILKFMVAHELFHYLEISRVGQIYKRFKFNGWRLGPYKKDRYIKGLSDVAAQAFTLSLLGWRFLPRFLII